MDFPPFLIRSEAYLFQRRPKACKPAELKQLRTKMPNSRSAMARDRGDGTNLEAASCSHSPCRRPAHLGGFSGSAWFSLAHPIRRTLSDARPSLSRGACEMLEHEPAR